MNYVDGQIAYYDYCKGDENSIIQRRRCMKRLKVNDRKVKFWFKSGPYYETNIRHLSTDLDIYNLVNEMPDSREVEIFVEHTDKDQWNYDVVDSEGSPLQDEEGLIDVNIIQKSDESDATSEECESFHDSNYSMEEDDVIFDKTIASTVEWVSFNGKNKDNQDKGKFIELGVASNMLAMFPNDTQEDDCATSDEELMSLHGDSDDENLKRSIVFNPTRDLEDPKFKFALNMIFSNSKEFKWAVEVQVVLQKKDVKFKKNESTRSRATCKVSNCKRFIFASKANQDEPFKIKTIGPDHSCGNQRDNKTIDSGFLAKKYVEEFRINPSWGVKEFQTHVMRAHNCTITRKQAYMAKKKALDLITETKEEQFDMLRNYCAELRRSNPGTTCILKLDESPETMGFLAGCRHIIEVDGCHLKGHQKGSQLLTAVGIDGSDNIYPIAFAVVEDLGISQNPFAWTFISDKQKGLMPAFDEIMPDVAHRFCVRHLHNNFKTEGFGGQTMKDILWKASRATTEPEFSKHMEEMAKLDSKAPEWFINKPPIHWSRAFFSSFPKCDVLLNNLCESFNSVLLHARDKYIWTMLELIRIYMMLRLQKNRDRMMKYCQRICPKIMLKLEKNKAKAAECIAIKSDQFHYQIEDIYLRLFSVNPKEKTCSCRRWDLTGIPCSHAIAAIWVKKDEPDIYVHECYTVE
ncbi:hypothetical protein KY290_025184 [Solanum tuberosum]|uniref:SWIM-type domain-containing protein n=2 Tax=Solanum TaxID=4107 RepID=A0ABQ7UUM4_SOLTU|nr:hypothetical protein KY284_023988 [Solanum tuberosum]KAH0754914.1 hypothetical protein KY290_025184 [Solanum tuberosum]